MSLADLLKAQARPGPTRIPAGIDARLSALKTHYGTVTAASKAIGIDRRTWSRIATGKIKRITDITAAKIENGVRDITAPARTFVGVDLSLTLRYDGRDRHLGEANWAFAESAHEAMTAALNQGDDNALVNAFIDGITEPWYRGKFSDVWEAEQADVEPVDIDDYLEGVAA